MQFGGQVFKRDLNRFYRPEIQSNLFVSDGYDEQEGLHDWEINDIKLCNLKLHATVFCF